MRDIIHDFIRKALTKQVLARDSKTRKVTFKEMEVSPSERLILLVEFSIACIVALTGLEAVHIVYIGTWNSEIFAAITGLIGTIVGLFLGAKA